MAGQFDETGNLVAQGVNHVNPQLLDILDTASQITGMKVEAYSGYRPGDPRFHGKGMATDIRIIGPDGRPLPNYQSPESFAAYETLAQAARQVQQEKYPDLDKQFRWGGYFSGDKGKYGALDLMHFDLGGSDKLGMAGGSWDKGLTSQQAANFPGVKSVGALAYTGEKQPTGAEEALNTLASNNPTGPAQGHFVPPPFTPGSGAGFTDDTNAFGSPAMPTQMGEPGKSEPVEAAPTVAPDTTQSDDDFLKAFLRPTGTGDGPQQNAAPSPQETDDDAYLKPFLADAPAAKMEAAKNSSPGAEVGSGFDKGKFASSLNSSASGFATGVPIVGPAINEGLNKAEAGVRYLWDGDKSYKDELDGVHAREAGDVKANPITNQLAQIGGGVAATGGLMAEFPLAFGASKAAGLGANALAGGVTGAAIGTADSAVRNGADGNKLMWGGGLGAAGGLAGPLLGPAAKYVGGKLAALAPTITPTGQAARNLLKAVGESGTSLPDMTSEMVRNPALSAMDTNDGLRQMGQKLAAAGGKPRAALNDAIQGRQDAAAANTSGAFDSALGGVPDVKAYLDGLKATTKANAKQAFGDALSNAKPVDISPVLAAIDAKVSPGVNGVVSGGSNIPMSPSKQALQDLRSEIANGNEQLTDPARLHQIQSDWRTTAETLQKSATGSDRLIGGEIQKIRQKLIDQIDQSAGGKYRPAQKQYADDNAIQDAFDKGTSVFRNGTGDAAIQNRPEFWQDWVKNATPAEVDAAKVGARVAVDQQMGSVRNAAAKGISIPEMDFNSGRLEALLGKNETAKLSQTLADQKAIAETNAKVLHGSKTAETSAKDDLIKVTQPSARFAIGPGTLGAGGAILSAANGNMLAAAGSLGAGAAAFGAKYGIQAALRARDVSRNRLMAEAISGGLPSLQNALAATARPADMGRAVGDGVNRLASLAAPTSAEQINQRIPINVPVIPHRPLELTVTPKR